MNFSLIKLAVEGFRSFVAKYSQAFSVSALYASKFTAFAFAAAASFVRQTIIKYIVRVSKIHGFNLAASQAAYRASFLAMTAAISLCVGILPS